MFFLHFIPDVYLQIAILGILVIGIVGFVVSSLNFIGFLIPYNPAIKLVSTLLLVAGTYFYGGYGVEMEWRTRTEDLKKQIALAEEKSKQVNVQIETRVVEKIKVIKEKVYENKQAIQQHKETINSECKLPDVARMLYNRSVTHLIPGGTADVDEIAAGINSAK
jgi:hypothetical protein